MFAGENTSMKNTENRYSPQFAGSRPAFTVERKPASARRRDGTMGSLAGRFLIAAALLTGVMVAQDASSAPRLLTLDDAVQLALANNRSLQIANLEVEKSKWQIAETKTKRLPSFSASVLGSQLLNTLAFTFKEGAFGTFPGTGPVPAKDTDITTPRRPTAYVVGQANQPLSQLYKIHLGIRTQELNAQLSSEKVRAARQSVIRDVK